MKASKKELLSFANNVEGAVHNAIRPDQSNYNSGPLWASINRNNFRTVTVPVAHAPMLDASLQKYAPFKPGDPLVVDAIHNYDATGDDFIYWIWPEGKANTFDPSGQAINLSTSAWFRSYQSDQYPKFLAQGNYADDVTLDTYLQLTTGLFPESCPKDIEVAEQIGARNALALTIINLRNSAGWSKKSTRHMAHKSFTNSRALNGFQVNAFVFAEEQTMPRAAYTLATVATTLSFSPNSYGGLYDGSLRLELTVKQKDGGIVSAQKSSKITLMNNPYVNPDGSMGGYGNIYEDSPAPDELQHLLYDNNEVTAEDLEEFTRLINEPIREDQTEIKPW